MRTKKLRDHGRARERFRQFAQNRRSRAVGGPMAALRASDASVQLWKGDGRGGAGSSSRSWFGFFGTRQQNSRNRAAARSTREDPNDTLAVIMSLRGVVASSIPER